MSSTEQALLSAVATRRANARNVADIWTERLLAAFGVIMLAITAYGIMRMLGLV